MEHDSDLNSRIPVCIQFLLESCHLCQNPAGKSALSGVYRFCIWLLRFIREIGMRKKEAANVQFRFSAKLFEELERRAKAYELTPGPMARLIVTEFLEDAERIQIRERLREVERQQLLLQEHLATAVEVILEILVTGRRPTEDEIRQWVNENLRSENPPGVDNPPESEP